jgi:hypothetical protein
MGSNFKGSNFITIPNDFVQSNIYTPEIVFIYALLQKNLTIRKQVIFNLSWLYNQLHITVRNTYSRKRINNILLRLEEDQYINYNCDINTIDKNKLIVASIESIEKYYVKILDSEFDIIYNHTNVDVYNLFSIFGNIKSRIDTKKYCYPSEKELKFNAGINSDTAIIKYLRILRDDLRLIKFANPGEIIITNEDNIKVVVQSNNIYVLYNDENILQEAIEHRKDEYKKNKIELVKRKNNKISANTKRSNSMKKHWEEKKKNKLNNILNESKEEIINV